MTAPSMYHELLNTFSKFQKFQTEQTLHMCDSAPAGGIIPCHETFTEATLTLHVWAFCQFFLARIGNQKGPKSVAERS